MLWLCVVIQVLMIDLLDGTHAYVHVYYFVGIAPTCCLVLSHLWRHLALQQAKIYAALRVAIVILIVEQNLEISVMYLRNWSVSDVSFSLFKECIQLKANNLQLPLNKGYVFRSSKEFYPMLGLCFGERQGSQKSEYGFFYKNDQIPSSCIKIDNSKAIILAKCEP